MTDVKTAMKKTRNRISILVVDDHPLVRQGIATTLSQEGDLHICGEASDYDEAMAQAGKLKPDIALVDLTLEHRNGLELIRAIADVSPDTKVIVLTMHDEHVYAERCLRSGARGFLMKSHGPERLVKAIRNVHEGRMYASEELLQRVLMTLATPTNPEREELSVLTDREFQIFELLGQGRTSKEVAEVLHLSSKTVDVHRIRIRKKLGVQSNSELVAFAVKWLQGHQTPSEI